MVVPSAQRYVKLSSGFRERASLREKSASSVKALYNKEKYAKVPFTLMKPSGSSKG